MLSCVWEMKVLKDQKIKRAEYRARITFTEDEKTGERNEADQVREKQ